MQLVRKATLADVEELAVLFDKFRQFYRQAPDLEGATNYIKSRLNYEDSAIYVASDNDILVGFTQLYPLFSSVGMKRMWLLNDLYVSEEHRGKNWGHQLIDAAKRLAANTGATAILIETEKTNTRAQKLYAEVGFEEPDTLFYYLTKF